MFRPGHVVFAVLPLFLFGIACSDEGEAQERGLHPVESHTIVYLLSGSTTGTVTEMSRNHGGATVRITETTMQIMGMTQSEHTRVITRGAEIVTIDLEANTATRMQNPMYDAITGGMTADEAEEMGREMMRSMGHVETGESRTVAGESCNVWTNSGLGQELCITSDAIMLSVSTSMMGMSFTQTATEVRRGDGGPDEMYEIPAGITVTEGPDLGRMFGQ